MCGFRDVNYLRGRVKGQQRLWMEAHSRGDIDDHTCPPEKEKTCINKIQPEFLPAVVDVCDITLKPCQEEPVWSSEQR